MHRKGPYAPKQVLSEGNSFPLSLSPPPLSLLIAQTAFKGFRLPTSVPTTQRTRSSSSKGALLSGVARSSSFPLQAHFHYHSVSKFSLSAFGAKSLLLFSTAPPPTTKTTNQYIKLELVTVKQKNSKLYHLCIADSRILKTPSVCLSHVSVVDGKFKGGFQLNKT